MTTTETKVLTTSKAAVAGVVGTLVSISLPPFFVGTLALQIGREIDFDAADLAVAVAAYYLVSALLSPLAGRFVAWCGPAVALRLAAGGSAVGLATVALADSAAVVVVALGLLGLPNSLGQPSSNQVLSGLSSERFRAAAFGLVQSAIPASTLVSGVLLASLGSAGSWRAATWIVAGIALATQLLIPFGQAGLPRRPPRQPLTREATGGTAVGGIPLVVALVVGTFLGSVAATTLPSFLASTGQHSGVSPQLVGVVQMLASLTCIVARVSASWAGGQRQDPAVSLSTVAVMLAGGAVGFVLLGTGSGWSFVLGAMVAYGLGWGWNGLFNLSVTLVRPSRIAAVTGLTQGGVYLGGVCGPLLFAAVAEAQSYEQAWYVIAAAGGGAALSIAYARQRWRRNE